MMRSQLKPRYANAALGNLGAFATSRDGNWLALGMRRGVLVVNLTSRQEEKWLPLDGTQTVFVGFSSDSRRLVIASGSGKVRCLQVPTFEEEGGFALAVGVHTFAIDGDGTRLVAVEKGGLRLPSAIRILQLPSGVQLARWTAHQAAIIDVSFVDNGSLMATCAHDGTVKLWRVSGLKSGKQAKKGEGR